MIGSRKYSKKWSIQITERIRDELKNFCKERGYKISAFTEIAILHEISGSILKELNDK